jgi:magnesium-transporting ATPase (P-type)
MKKTEENAIEIKKIRNLFLIILGFLALGAIGGGIVLLISPTGELIGLPLSEFKNIPFDSYLIPAIILVSVLGIIPVLLIISLVKKPESKLAEQINIFRDMHWSWTCSIYIAFILIGWIHIELIFLQGVVHWLHTFYMFYAILMIIIALLPQMRYLYKKGSSPE